MIRNAIDSYNKYGLAYHTVINSKVKENDYKGAQFKAIINYLKVKKDETMPTRVADLRVRYTEIKGRKPLTLREFLTDKGYCTEENISIVDRLLAPVVPAAPLDPAVLVATDQYERADELLDEIV